MVEKKDPLDSVTVGGLPLKEHLEKEEEAEKKSEIKTEIRRESAKPLYHHPRPRFMGTLRRKNKEPIRYYSGEKIMAEQFEIDIKQFKTQKAKILAVMLMGKEVTAKEIANYVRKRTGIKLDRNSVSSLIGQICKGPLKKYVTKIKHTNPNHFAYLVEHSFTSTEEALKWEKAHGGGYKYQSKKKEPKETKKEPEETKPKKTKNEAESILIELPNIKIRIDFK